MPQLQDQEGDGRHERRGSGQHQCNLTGRRYAYRTVTNPSWFVVDLGTTDFGGPARVAELNWTGGFVPTSI